MSGVVATFSMEIGASAWEIGASTSFGTTFSPWSEKFQVVGGAISKGVGAGKVGIGALSSAFVSRFWRDGVLVVV